jgi:hypothetical protein
VNDRGDLLPRLRMRVAGASQGLFELADGTGQSKPAFSRREKPSSMLRLTFGLRNFLFGPSSALDARKHSFRLSR